MKANAIIQANDVENLKKIGSYKDVKKTLEKELDNKFGGRSWVSLLKKVSVLKRTSSSEKKEALYISNNETLSNARQRISNLLGIDIKVKTREELEIKIKKIILLFSANKIDPYEYYERTKFSKFQNSSKLEGIKIDIPNESNSLQNIIAKYQR